MLSIILILLKWSYERRESITWVNQTDKQKCQCCRPKMYSKQVMLNHNPAITKQLNLCINRILRKV